MVVTDRLKSQMADIRGRMDMLLGALEDCRMASISRDPNGKLMRIVMNPGTAPANRDATGRE